VSLPAQLHETSLIALLAIRFVLAMSLGLLANMVRISPIVDDPFAGRVVPAVNPQGTWPEQPAVSRGALAYTSGRCCHPPRPKHSP
jgi:hypothetical protein